MLNKANRTIKLWDARIMSKALGTHPHCLCFPYKSEMVFLGLGTYLGSETKALEIYLRHHSPSLSVACHPTNHARGMGLWTATSTRHTFVGEHQKELRVHTCPHPTVGTEPVSAEAAHLHRQAHECLHKACKHDVRREAVGLPLHRNS